MSMEKRLGILEGIKRVVIKIGSGVLSSGDGRGLSVETLERLVGDICHLEADRRFQVVLVASGAVMAGSRMLSLKQEHLSIPIKQACAAVGQVKLINSFDAAFAGRGKKVGQILLTHDDISNRRRYLNARNTMTSLFNLGVLPVINENDSAAVHEIKFGDNDTLAAMVTSIADADLLLILSDVDGLFDSDPNKNSSAKLIEDVSDIDDDIKLIAGESSSTTGVGGMKSKIIAAQTACVYGIPTWIISGKAKDSIARALREGKGGTFFHPREKKVARRKHWIGHILKPSGRLLLDDGAKKAVIDSGKSLLPSGIKHVDGRFESGESVSLIGEDGKEFARGLVNYHAFELEKIKGKRSDKIEALLGYKSYDEVIHRDDLVLTGF